VLRNDDVEAQHVGNKTMFTLEIGGTPTAITDANEDEARRIFDSETFRTDMQRWITEGGPVWDGRAPIALRPSTEEERAHFQAPDPHPPHGAENDEGPTIMLLVDAYDPDDIEED
jgi:hypothetical protein